MTPVFAPAHIPGADAAVLRGLRGGGAVGRRGRQGVGGKPGARVGDRGTRVAAGRGTGRPRGSGSDSSGVRSSGGDSSGGGGGGGSSNLRAFEAGQERQAARKAAQALRLRRGSVGTAGLPPSRANESFTAWKTASSAAAVDPNELFGNAAFSPVKVPSTRA